MLLPDTQRRAACTSEYSADKVTPPRMLTFILASRSPLLMVARRNLCNYSFVGLVVAIRVSSICHVLRYCCGPESDVAACFSSQPLATEPVPGSRAKLSVVCLSGPGVSEGLFITFPGRAPVRRLTREGCFLDSLTERVLAAVRCHVGLRKRWSHLCKMRHQTL